VKECSDVVVRGESSRKRGKERDEEKGNGRLGINEVE
jgi:hypothetical protein